MSTRLPLPDDIKELIRLVRAGKLFDVQRWIADGKQTVPPKPYSSSPLRVAVETGFHSMIEILLQIETDQGKKNHLLRRAVWNNKLELIKLLVEYGADPHDVGFDDVCRTGNPELMRFFLDRGIDAVTGQPFARALCRPRRPQLGIYIHYRDKIPGLKHQVNLALRHHAREGNLYWVCLLLWAGGDAHVKLPDIGKDSDPENDTSALEEAIYHKRNVVVDKIGIDPKKDNLNGLLEKACSAGNMKIIDKLMALGADVNGETEYGPMERLIWNFECNIRPPFGNVPGYGVENALGCIILFASKGGRWQPKDNYGVKGLRRELHRLDARWITKVIRKFHEHNVCSKEILLELISSTKMKQLLGEHLPRLKKMVSGI
ncbi:MAG TPA: hypothetical protein VH280_16830 [Verrucomicrobiae bacterium]|jgi:hypothetical protein|nr:hypothetical protein [Verrucomicrobiae bacterium]